MKCIHMTAEMALNCHTCNPTPDHNAESVQQAAIALHKLMTQKCSNFDKGAVIHWAEKGYYTVKETP